MSDITDEDENDGSGSSGGKRMSDPEFAEACRLYEKNEMGLAEIAAKFGVSRQALSRRFKNNGIIRGSKAVVGKEEKTGPTYHDQRATWIEETRISGYNALKQSEMLARKIVADCLKSGGQLDTVDDALRAAGRFNKLIVDNVAARLQLLEAQDFVSEDELPQLILEDMTDQDILDHHKATGAMPEDATLEDLLEETLDEEDLV